MVRAGEALEAILRFGVVGSDDLRDSEEVAAGGADCGGRWVSWCCRRLRGWIKAYIAT